MTVVVPLSAFLRLISLFALRVFRVPFVVLRGYLFRLKKGCGQSQILCVPNSFPVPLMAVVAVARLI